MIKAEEKLAQVLAAYDFESPVLSTERYGHGHVNDTFCIYTADKRYILQRISRVAFPRPEELMENMVNVTSFIKQILDNKGEDSSRGTLSILPTREGKFYYSDDADDVWRVTHFIENTHCLQSVENAEQFYASAKAFGRFQRLLGSFPAESLYETIERFHDTENRLAKFKKALEEDKLGRAALVKPEIDFVLRHTADCSVCMQALRNGILPLRVTHNDTKLNNVLIDSDSGEAICVLDLDTVMPGLSVYDFGDSIRFGANHCKEDEQDLNRVNFDPELYEIYARGFLEEAVSVLTEKELEYLPWGAKLMTLECGIRFLTDYLEGDNYFRITREHQNLDRCRTQFKLVSDMENCWQQMTDIVAKCAAEARTFSAQN